MKLISLVVPRYNYWKGSRYEAGDKYTVTEDHTFVAQWEQDKAPGNKDTNPNDPSNGDGSGTNDEKDGKDSKGNGTDTGDDSDLMLWFTLMTLSLLAMLSAAICIRRNRHRGRIS